MDASDRRTQTSNRSPAVRSRPTTTSATENGLTPRLGSGWKPTGSAAGRSVGSQHDVGGPPTPNELGNNGQRPTLSVAPTECQSLAPASTQPRQTDERLQTSGGVDGPGLKSKEVSMPNVRGLAVWPTPMPSEPESGPHSPNGVGTTPRPTSASHAGTRPSGTPSSATQMFVWSPMPTFAASYIVRLDGAPTAPNPTLRRSITWFPSSVVADTPLGTSCGPAVPATRQRAGGWSWSSATGAATAGASLPDREGAVSLRCRAASSRTTQREGR